MPLSSATAGAERQGSAPAIVSWRMLVEDAATPRAGAYNMAVDHALLEAVQRDQQPVLRLYRWRPACLSFGRNQPARGCYDATMAAHLGIDIVRRPTGGLAVLHDNELTYSVVAPCSLVGGPRDSYMAINRALVAGLQQLGVPAQLSGGARRSPFGTMQPCFAEPAAGEVIARGCKLVGSAQRYEKRTILQHGSILLDGLQEDVARIASVPFDLANRATNVRSLLGAVPPMAEIVAAIAAGFAPLCGGALEPSSLSPGEAVRAAELVELYASAEWTWRR